MKVIIMQFSPLSVFIPFRFKYTQHSALKNPQSIFLPQIERPYTQIYTPSVYFNV
jgi:hypothetical protein